jgi:hypothetical protein
MFEIQFQFQLYSTLLRTTSTVEVFFELPSQTLGFSPRHMEAYIRGFLTPFPHLSHRNPCFAQGPTDDWDTSLQKPNDHTALSTWHDSIPVSNTSSLHQHNSPDSKDIIKQGSYEAYHYHMWSWSSLNACCMQMREHTPPFSLARSVRSRTSSKSPQGCIFGKDVDSWHNSWIVPAL